VTALGSDDGAHRPAGGAGVIGKTARHGWDGSVIGRRSVLQAATLLAARPAAAALPVPASDALAFRLMRRGSQIGLHSLSFSTQGDTLTVHIAVEAQVTLMSIPLVRYRHRVVETWQDGVLAGVIGDTDKNGRMEWVRAHRTASGLMVQGSHTAEYLAPEPAIGTSYWNKRMLDGPMISMEDGVLLKPKVTPLPAESIPLASGAMIPTSHYNLSGSFNVDVWYDMTDTWAGLGFTAADGSVVRYERL
jgi:hypothetical protein